MPDKKEKWEMEYTQDTPISQPKIPITDLQEPKSIIGKTLDARFLIEKDLSEDGADKGGIGLIYLAKDRKLLDKEVIVKILNTDSLQNKDVIRKFQHEKEALIRLEHPNIVRLIDSGTLSDGKPFLVMEYIRGHSLRRVLNERGKLSFDFIAHIISGVTEALSTAHSQKILHRDIKPENIMLTPQEENFDYVRLIDFGIARVENSKFSEVTDVVRGIGSPYYIAPEQMDGRLEQTPAADIYSLAVVIYEMLTGEKPFQADSMLELFQTVEAGVKIPPRSLRSDIPAKAEKTLLSALEFGVENRPQNARIFGRDLVNALLDNSKYKTNSHDQFLKPTEPSIKRKFNKKLLWLAAGLFIMTMISIPVGLAILHNIDKNSKNKSVKLNAIETTSANIQSVEKKIPLELTYFLNVQKMRDGKPFEKPFKSSGQEIFENGYKFKMNFQSNIDGFIYLFSEDKNEQGKAVYHILYPTPKINKGSAQIVTKQLIETANNTFSGGRGTEIVWLIWTTAESNELESLKQSAFDAQGKVNDEKNVEKLTEFLQINNDKNVEANKDTTNQQTVIRGKGDKLVYRLELEHR